MEQYAIPQKLSSLTLPWETDWAALFGDEPGKSRPLILEIGFGRGTFLVHLAKQHRDHNVIGVEVSNRCLDAAERAIRSEGVTNARVIHATGETALHHLFTPNSLSQLHLNFPDPWFKSGHHHRRIMRRSTLDAMVSRLKAGGMFYLATDIFDYAEMSAELLAATPQLTNTLDAPYAVNNLPGRGIITKYEATAIQEGRDRYYFAYRRNDMPALDIPVIKDLPMPHLIFYSPLSLDEMRAAFHERVKVQHSFDTRLGTAHVHLMDVFQSDHALLVEVHASEPTIDQRFAITVLPRPNGEYTIQLSTIGHPRPTEGVHEAVRLLGERLIALHEDAVKRHDSLRE